MSLNTFTQIKNPFTQNVRLFPVELPFPYSKQWTFIIELPDYYQIKSIPQSVNYLLPDATGKFIYTVNMLNNTLSVVIKLNIESSIYPGEYYFHLKEFFRQLTMKLNETIVIERAE